MLGIITTPASPKCAGHEQSLKVAILSQDPHLPSARNRHRLNHVWLVERCLALVLGPSCVHQDLFGTAFPQAPQCPSERF